MISIIISTYNKYYFEELTKNIDKTIGVPFEIIKIENPKCYSITQAYNIGAAKAQYDILCFIHEDVAFLQKDWGYVLINYFKTIQNIGLVGVAGAKYKLPAPGGWGHFNGNYNKTNIVQQSKDGSKVHHLTSNTAKFEYVKVLDGVFMATTRLIWNEFKFDENIPGFHIYDIDFSLRISQKYNVAVSYEILMEHFSPGNFGDDWVIATIKYHRDTKKKHLFDDYNKSEPLLRSPYYYFLKNSNISFKYKLLYLKSLGVDLEALRSICVFLFPKTVKNVINLINRG